jgi:hypothetical protein
MKKILLATVLTAVSLTSTHAEHEVKPAGKGWYIAGQVGGGVLNLAGEGKFYQQKDGVLKEDAKEDKGLLLPWGGVQFIWGYSHRFAQDMTVGFEAALVSPALRLGYMIKDCHHLAVGVHYATFYQGLLSTLVQKLKEDMAKEHPELKDSFKTEFDTLSGFGLSLGYEYFFPSKNFFRTQLRADYYGGTINLGDVTNKKTKLPVLINGKGHAWDITLYVGFGTQW